MKLIAWLCSVILLISFARGLTMESPETSNDHKMVPINSMQDAAFMDDKLIAFTAISNLKYLFGVMLSAFSCGQKYYYIKQVVPAGTQCRPAYYFNDESLKGIRLKARTATQEEMIALHATIRSQKNEFSGVAGLAFLEQQSGFELQKKKIA